MAKVQIAHGSLKGHLRLIRYDGRHLNDVSAELAVRSPTAFEPSDRLHTHLPSAYSRSVEQPRERSFLIRSLELHTIIQRCSNWPNLDDLLITTKLETPNTANDPEKRSTKSRDKGN